MLPSAKETCFVALDFETADPGRDSACALGLVRVDGGQVAARKVFLIRPPRRRFVFTHIHGISWQDVAQSPTFGDIWPEVQQTLAGAHFLAAHHASFDRGVLSACCEAAGEAMPPQPFECTVKLARRMWNIRPTTLPDVCRHLRIPLRHHDAASDAEACAGIVVQAIHEGWRPVARA